MDEDLAFGDDYEAELGFMARLLVQATLPDAIRPVSEPWAAHGALSLVCSQGG